MFLDRYLIFVSTSYFLGLGISINYVINIQKHFIWLSGLMVLYFLLAFNPNVDNNREVRETVDKIIELKDSNTRVIICPQHFAYNFAYYYDRELFKEADNATAYMEMVNKLKKKNVFAINNITDFPLSDSHNIIYLDAAASFSFPDNMILHELTNQFLFKGKHEFREIFTIYEFRKE